MNIHEAITVAIKKEKCIALPNDEKCDNGGYHIRLKPYMNNMVCLEFYGTKMELNQFSLAPKEIIRTDWIVV